MAYKLVGVDEESKFPPRVETRIKADRALDVNKSAKETLVKSDIRATRRAWVGAHVDPVGTDPGAGASYYNPVYDFEATIKSNLDLVSYYRAIGPDTAAAFVSEVVPELARNPDRKVMYALEIWRNNQTFINEFDSQTGIYPHLLATLNAIKNSGYADRVYLAPFHEGNGGSNYPWEMYYTAQDNTPAKYKSAFQKVVTLARSIGLESKFIQWFLTTNGGTGNRQNLAEAYVGDSWVDIVGVSYYNRSGATGYYNYWLPVGADLREFASRVERFSSRNIWICESGCAASNSGHDKGKWYADLVTLTGSNEIPRLEAAILFLRNGTTTDMRLENDSQRNRLGRAINETRRQTKHDDLTKYTRNLIPPSVSIPTTESTWAISGTNIVASISNNVPDGMDKGATSIRFTKPASPGISESDYAASRSITSALVPYVIGEAYTFTFRARASVDGFLLTAGIRQNSGDALFAGANNIPISSEWDTYVVQLATTAIDTGAWRIPYFRFGLNAAASWIEITDMQIRPGNQPQANIEQIMKPRIHVGADATNILWSCEAADIYDVTLAGNRTLNAPTGVAYDGQEMTIRVRQDATGGRTLALASAFYKSSVPYVLASEPGSVTILTFTYDSVAGKWGLTYSAQWRL